jgi:hypothetical protein
MIKHYASLAELRSAWFASGGLRNGSPMGSAWYNHESPADTARYAESGNAALVPQAEAMLAKLDLAIETPRRAWERAPAGAFPWVPDVLAGLPTPMRRQVHVPDERAPVNILTVTTSSAGVSSAVLERRGIVILAAAMALSRLRPVNLCAIAMLDGPKDGSGETVIINRINTTPLDLATACWMLTSAGYARRITYDMARTLNNFSGGWPRGFLYGAPERYYDNLTARLGYRKADTLFIGAAHISDPLLADPLAWVQGQINRFTTQTTET